MTENEAIKELETSRNLAKMCTQNSERKREIESYEIAIKALEEIQAYRAIGTVKEIMDMLFSTEQEHDEVLKYRAIGTVEEFKALKEKAEAKKPILNNPKINEFYVKEAKLCPVCHSYINNYSGDYCRDCGQRIDWNE